MRESQSNIILKSEEFQYQCTELYEQAAVVDYFEKKKFLYMVPSTETIFLSVQKYFHTTIILTTIEKCSMFSLSRTINRHMRQKSFWS